MMILHVHCICYHFVAGITPIDIIAISLYTLKVLVGLLVAYAAAIFLKWSKIWAKVVGWWSRRRGQLQEDILLVHSLPYYLAMSRSTCEARKQLKNYTLKMKD